MYGDDALYLYGRAHINSTYPYHRGAVVTPILSIIIRTRVAFSITKRDES